MYVKAVLFVGIGLICASLLVFANPRLETCILLALCIWSFSRAYYFAFYVIERYIDPTFKFSGLLSAFKFVCASKARK